MYTGLAGARLADEAQRLGFGLTHRDLEAATPVWRSTLRVRFIKQTSLHFPMPRTPAGTLGAKAVAMLVAEGSFKNTTGAARAHLFAEATQRALADGAAGFYTVKSERDIMKKTTARKKITVNHTILNKDYAERLMAGFRTDRLTELAIAGRESLPAGDPGGATSFTVLDNNGGAVACAFTMNGPFGTGRAVPGTGIYLASYPDSPAARDLSLGAVIVDQDFGNKLFLIGAAAGGVASQTVVSEIGLSAAYDAARTIDDEVAAKARVYRDLAGRTTYVETGAPAALVDGLRQRGHKVMAVDGLSRVNMAFCSNGLPNEVSGCRIVTGPRGFGYATVSDCAVAGHELQSFRARRDPAVHRHGCHARGQSAGGRGRAYLAHGSGPARYRCAQGRAGGGQ